jgi:hypothetical protein
MSKSRYIRYTKHRLPKPKRGSIMPAATTVGTDRVSDEEGKYMRCRNCGFPVDTTRDNPGGTGMGDDGVQVQDFDYDEPNRVFRGSDPLPGNLFNRPALGEGDYNIPVLDTLDMIGTAIQLGLDGTADSFTYTPRQIIITSGCPFCGADII